MGPIGAVSTSALQEMKEVLGMISDVDAIKSAMSDLVDLKTTIQSDLEAAQMLNDETKHLRKEIENERINLDRDGLKVIADKSALSELERKLSKKKAEIDAAEASLNARISEAGEIVEKAKQSAKIIQDTAEKEKSRADEISKSAMALKAEYEEKLLKLKAAMGV